MKLLFFITYLAACTSAAGLAGAYERVLFYCAYAVDVAASGGVAKTIAPGCKDCTSFNNFIKYIDGLDTTPNIIAGQITKVDDAANSLTSYKGYDFVQNDYIPGRVVKNVQSVADVIANIANFLEAKGPVMNTLGDANVLAALSDALQRVQFLQTNAKSEAVIKNLRSSHPGVKIETLTRELHDGGKEYQFLNQGATKRANPDIDVDGSVKQSEDTTQKDRVKSTRRARASSRGCKRKGNLCKNNKRSLSLTQH